MSTDHSTASPFAPLFLVLLGISVVAAYLLVRRGQAGTTALLAIGSAIDVVLFGMFALAQGDPAQQAIAVGIFLGILFNVLTVLIALFFRRNEQGK